MNQLGVAVLAVSFPLSDHHQQSTVDPPHCSSGLSTNINVVKAFMHPMARYFFFYLFI
jgi:hypothetical protein